jgi:serine phosphatase RsbU (regulator of sigma subunit)
LLVYSDGLTEARNRSNEFFGDERLLALATQLRGLPAEAAGARLVSEVERFTGDQRWSDDLSLVLARRAPAPPAS